MPDTSQLLSQFYVTLDGADAPETFMRDLMEITVENSLHLPDVATLVLHDPHLLWIDADSLAPGKAVKVSARGQKGEKIIAIIDNNGYVLAPVPVAPVNETDMVLLPDGLKALKRVAKEVGLDLKGASLNLDGGFDAARNRKCIFNAGLMPNIKENPRHRKTTKRGRTRFFNEAIHALRMRVERTFAWEDKFKRLLLRFARIQQRHYGMKVMAYTLINLRAFCGA